MSLLSLEALQNIYNLTAHNLKLAHDHDVKKFMNQSEPKFKVNDSVMLKNHI